MLVALLALFVALTGTSYAVSKLPKNSVGNSQLKKNAVTSDKVKDRSLLAKDFKSGQLPAGAKGDVGAQGAMGPAGTAGAAGADGGVGATGATGAPGLKGATGITGQVGPTGSPGLLATGYGTDASAVTIGTSGSIVSSLGGSSYSISGAISLTENAQIFASFSTSIAADDGTMVFCQIGLDAANIFADVLTEEAFAGVEGTELANLTVAGNIAVGPGSYDLGVTCRTNVDGETADLEWRSLTVYAVPE